MLQLSHSGSLKRQFTPCLFPITVIDLKVASKGEFRVVVCDELDGGCDV